MATEVYMYRNVTADEGDTVRIEMRRDGDLSGYTSGHFALDFSDTGAGYGDIEWRGSSGDGLATYVESQNLGTYSFGPGEDRIILEFELTDDTSIEADERIYVTILSASGNTDIGDERDYIEIHDNDENSTSPNSESSNASFTIGNAATITEGTGDSLVWTISYDGNTTGWQHSEQGGPMEITYEIVNDRTGEVVDGGTVGNGNIHPNDIEYRTIEFMPTDDDVENGSYTDYSLRITSTNISGPTGNVATGRVNEDDEEQASSGGGATPQLSAAQLQTFETSLAALVNEDGLQASVDTVQSSTVWSRIAKTLEDAAAFTSDVVADLVQAGLSLTATTAYAYDEVVEMYSYADDPLVQPYVAALPQPVYWHDVATIAGRFGVANYDADRPIAWFSANLPEEQTALRPGDYVDNRLVIHQPLIAFDANGDPVAFTSWQGRYDDQETSGANGAKWDNFSHGSNRFGERLGSEVYDHGFDWGVPGNAVTQSFILAPVAGEVVYSGSAGSLGEIVTIKFNQGFKDIYISLAHLVEDSIPQDVQTGDMVEAGQIVGIMGGSGGWDVHLHMSVGSELDSNNQWANASTAVNGDTPAIFVWFNDATIAERHEVNSGVAEGENLKQDYGFPIGDTDTKSGLYSEPGLAQDETLVATNIKPTFTYDDVVNATSQSVRDDLGFDSSGSALAAYTQGSAKGGGTSFTLVDGDGVDASEEELWGFDERFDGTSGTDVVNGGSGNDNFVATLGDDYYRGGIGDNDQVSFSAGVAVSDLSWSYDSGAQVLRSYHDFFGADYYDSTVEAFWSITPSDNDLTWFSRDSVLDIANSFVFDPAVIGGLDTVSAPSSKPVAIEDSSGGGSSSTGGLVFTHVNGDGFQFNGTSDYFDEQFEGNAGYDVIDGGAGRDSFIATAGNDYYRGGSEGDQYTIIAGGVAVSDISWYYDDVAQMLQGEHATFGIDLFEADIEGFWSATASENGQTWISRQYIIDNWATAFTLDPAAIGGSTSTTLTVAEAAAHTNPYTDPDTFQWKWEGDQFAGDETIIGSDQADEFVASSGDDIIYGAAGYDQVSNTLIALVDLAIGAAADGTIHTYSTATGYDIHDADVEAWWFQDGGWQSRDDMLLLAEDTFVFV